MDNRKRVNLLLGQTTIDVDTSAYADGQQSRGVYDAEKMAVMYPIDPRTGLPSNDLVRMTDPVLSSREREAIMSRIGSKIQGVFMPSDLSDEDLFQLIPTRYLTDDALDIQLWRDYLSRDVLPNMSDSAKNAVEEQAQELPQPTEEGVEVEVH